LVHEQLLAKAQLPNSKQTNAAKKLKQSVSDTKVSFALLVVKLSDITEKRCAILPQAAAQTHTFFP
jgi:hypothetical protein